MTGPLLVIALSARPFVQAAHQAGFFVHAIDAFRDTETCALAEKTIAAETRGDGFEPNALRQALHKLKPENYSGVLYGSGFDAQPELLAEIARQFPLIGNTPEVMGHVKNACGFFATLDRLSIPYPPVLDTLPVNVEPQQYLRKHAGGCGGTHIRFAETGASVTPQYYFQQYLSGKSLSLLFLAEANKVSVVGFNEQWLAPSEQTPFRYGGAVSHADVAPALRLQMQGYAQRLAQAFNLRGLNSLDVVLHDGQAYVLEINPRLSATFELYANNLFGNHGDLLLRHIAACSDAYVQPMPESTLEPTPATSNAHAVVYAAADITLPAAFDWPAWVTDTPVVDTKINAQKSLTFPSQTPICSVMAQADSATAAKQLAQTRVKMLLDSIAAVVTF